MTKTLHDRWLEDPENRAIYEEEGLVHDASDLLFEMMETEELSQADVAELLECSHSNVSQLLGGGRNLTLKSLARFAWVLGYRINLAAEKVFGAELPAPAFVEDPDTFSVTKRRSVQMEAREGSPIVVGEAAANEPVALAA